MIDREYLTDFEFAAALSKMGIAMSKETVRKLRYAGKIKSVTFGHRTPRIHISEIANFIGRAKRAS